MGMARSKIRMGTRKVAAAILVARARTTTTTMTLFPGGIMTGRKVKALETGMVTMVGVRRTPLRKMVMVMRAREKVVRVVAEVTPQRVVPLACVGCCRLRVSAVSMSLSFWPATF